MGNPHRLAGVKPGRTVQGEAQQQGLIQILLQRGVQQAALPSPPCPSHLPKSLPYGGDHKMPSQPGRGYGKALQVWVCQSRPGTAHQRAQPVGTTSVRLETRCCFRREPHSVHGAKRHRCGCSRTRRSPSSPPSPGACCKIPPAKLFSARCWLGRGPPCPPASVPDPHLGPHNGAASRSPSQELWSVQKTMTVNLVTGFSANVIPFY